MKSHIGMRFCVGVYSIGVCFYQSMNCFSAIYFTSYPKGCKLLKIIRRGGLPLGLRKTTGTFIYILYYKFNFYRTSVMYFLTGRQAI